MSDKNLIRQRFHRGLQSYDQAAVIQHVMARRMVAILEAHTAGKFERIFEIGCGAGVLTRLLPHHLDYQDLAVNDLVPECIRYLEQVPNLTFVPGDIEKLQDWPEKNDLILSNAVFQWLNNPAQVIAHCRDSLRPRGILCFSSFGPENMRQIRMVLGKGLHYYTLAEFCDLVKDDFEIIQADEECSTLEFNSPLAVLRHFRATGVAALERMWWTKNRLEEFCRQYQEQFSNQNGNVELTYHPLYVTVRRK